MDSPGSSVQGLLQARILEWVAIPFSRGIFPTQGSNPGLPHCRQIPYHLSHWSRPCLSSVLVKTCLVKVMWLCTVFINMGDKPECGKKPRAPPLPVVSHNPGTWNDRDSWLLPSWFWLCLTYPLDLRKALPSERPGRILPRTSGGQNLNFSKPNEVANQKARKQQGSKPCFLWAWEVLTLMLSLISFKSMCLFIKHMLLLVIVLQG